MSLEALLLPCVFSFTLIPQRIVKSIRIVFLKEKLAKGDFAQLQYSVFDALGKL